MEGQDLSASQANKIIYLLIYLFIYLFIHCFAGHCDARCCNVMQNDIYSSQDYLLLYIYLLIINSIQKWYECI